jgi:hypothetical protein
MRLRAFSRAIRLSCPILLLCAACATSGKPPASYVMVMRRDVAAVVPAVESQWVREVLARAAELPSRAPRVVWRDASHNRAVSDAALSTLSPKDREGLAREAFDDESYYAKYSSPLAYARMLDLAARLGLDGLAGKKVVDFGYGDIGQLQLFAKAGAQAIGIDPSPLLEALYDSKEDTAFPPGSVVLASGRWPAEEPMRTLVGGEVDVFFSKNTLKRGYVRPAPPPGQSLDPKKVLDLGVPPEQFLPALHAATKPGALVFLYNICPAPSRGPEFLPWSDGRSPFTREEWDAAGFDLVAFDVDDTGAARALGRALGWDRPPESMNLKDDLFAWYTAARRR